MLSRSFAGRGLVYGLNAGRLGIWKPFAAGAVVGRRCLNQRAVADDDVLADLPRFHVVDTCRRAEEFMEKVRSLPPNTVYGCDTEVDIDLVKQSPVGNGNLTCISVFAGDKVDFGDGPLVWIDTLDGEDGLVDIVKPFFESNDLLKVWHNYSFDRHILYNSGIDCQGFAGDTMHMARLLDSSLDKGGGGGGYSLEALSNLYGSADKQKKVTKTGLKKLFGVPVLLKNGLPGKSMTIPPIPDIQRNLETREKWIQYSCYDAKCTLELYYVLRSRLEKRNWAKPQPGANGMEEIWREKSVQRRKKSKEWSSLMELYHSLLLPFGDLLTDIERAGFCVDLEHLKAIEKEALSDKQASEDKFRKWLVSCGAFQNQDDAAAFNPASTLQKQLLFFSKKGELKSANGEIKPAEFKTENTVGFIEEGKLKPLRTRTVKVSGLGITPTVFSPSGWPQTSSAVLKTLAGNPDAGSFGTAKRMAGEEGCRAIAGLNHAASVDTLLNTFIRPLQERLDKESRVHCSLNLNTETGRLSSRNPNLQNQPALEKDVYKIRKAFVAKPGHSLIVADYGQLELRVLAHISKCTSMIDAFEKGGDFHSRTALGMFPEIKRDEEAGGVLLEWDYPNNDPPPVPLIKDKYASERRKAKVLNFSIAYGKTAFGLSADFGVSKGEAEETLNLWYADRPEVLAWQEATKKFARLNGFVLTMWGRERKLNFGGGSKKDYKLRGMAERAAINTPIQGSAADIVMAAMIKISRNERLKKLGWKMILQVHDEVVLEGPEESAEEAQKLVVHDMEHPTDETFLVDMLVDSNIAKSWYEAK